MKELIKKYLWKKIQSNNVMEWGDVQRLLSMDKTDIKEIINNSADRNYISETMKWVKILEKVREQHSGAAISFSQSGEDMVIRSLNRWKKEGFFVDIGAHHPIRFSNTFYFYLEGWTGINVDPIPGIMDLFNEIRPRDINLEIAVGKEGVSEFYQFEEGAYNTFDKKIAENMTLNRISPLVKVHQLKKIPLDLILEKYLPAGKTIDLLTVDAEGLDVEILETNNWKKFRPHYICAECHTTDESRPMNPRNILEQNGYSLIAQTQFSSIYQIN